MPVDRRLRDRASTSGADGDLSAVITALDDDDLATVWSDDTTLGWVSEALVLTDGEPICRGSISCAD
jgi:hypothetical protein